MHDFAVDYDPEKDSMQDVVKKILYSLIVKRNIHHKPTVIFVQGDSGEGKSMTVIKLQYVLLQMIGLELKDYLQDINVFVPMEYPTKLDRLLFEKSHKKINYLAVHEARELVRAGNWQKFITQAIGDINAMSRGIKPMTFFIVSQFIRDITIDIRYTLTYYLTCSRPLSGKTRVRWYVLWKDDRDLEHPMLRKRKVRGYLRLPTGKWKQYSPTYFEIDMAPKDCCDLFDKLDREAKADRMRRKMESLVKEMNLEFEEQDRNIKTMVKFYTDDIERLQTIGKQKGKKFKLNPEVKEMHNLVDTDYKLFEKLLNEAIVKKSYHAPNEDSQIPERIEQKEEADGPG